ncbi:MAG TPA: RidA family protein [Candidatus Acidoferrales bacterium]|nr:RidA family protein [Candidatus Acidoferrales bacterium]
MSASPLREHVPPAAGAGTRPYSGGVLVKDTFYISGHIGFLPGTRSVPADIDQEIRFMMDGFRDTLARAGMTMNELVSVQIFASDMSLYDRFNAIYVGYFQPPLPARAFLGAGSLVNGAHFEILGVAVKPS